MFLPKYKWIKGQKYYLYKIYNRYEHREMSATINRYRKKNGSKYKIITFGAINEIWMPEKRYALYLNKTIGMDKFRIIW